MSALASPVVLLLTTAIQAYAHVSLSLMAKGKWKSSERVEARYVLPVGANLNMVEGQKVAAGDMSLRFPGRQRKLRTSLGDLPRVAELFEARKPKEFAVISEIEGFISFGKDTKGKRKVIISPEIGDPA